MRPFVLDFEALTAIPLIEYGVPEPRNKRNTRKTPVQKRKQPKRSGKLQQPKNDPEKDGDNLPRKVMIYKGNKFYCDSKSDRKLIWKCSTSRFTNCTAQLTTKPNGTIMLAGTHDHANNTE